ncbi:hypothetical protein VTP01DRAFT_1484 [Rhizomucor pusillus]|uniref:uncharacterized protein n=1 Tax=Rhizomucor pusillus TaxID=4840 RepID=UPI0037428881
MPKGRKEKSAKSKIPYARPDKHDSTKITKTAPGASKSKEKTIKLKNERLADQLDELMVDLSAHLVPRKKSKKTTMETDSKTKANLQAAQREYEKTQNDMEDALGLLTRL